MNYWSDSIDSKTFEHDGFDVTIYVVPDADSSPFDAECYSQSDVQAWRDDEWFYVGFVYVASRDGIELGSASIWGTEWDFPGANDSSIDAWIAEDYYHPDLLKEAVTEARAEIVRLTR